MPSPETIETPCIFCSSVSTRFWTAGKTNAQVRDGDYWEIKVFYKHGAESSEVSLCSLVPIEAMFQRVQRDGFLAGESFLIPKESITGMFSERKLKDAYVVPSVY
jgi:hypothetical protein